MRVVDRRHVERRYRDPKEHLAILCGPLPYHRQGGFSSLIARDEAYTHTQYGRYVKYCTNSYDSLSTYPHFHFRYLAICNEAGMYVNTNKKGNRKHKIAYQTTTSGSTVSRP